MIERLLEDLAEAQINHAGKIAVAALFLTLGLATGIPEIQLETDFQDSLPDDLPPIQAEDKVESEFRSSSSIIILFQTNDRPLKDSYVTDVRDPELLNAQKDLGEALEKEPIVGNVESPGMNRVPNSIDEVKNFSELEPFFNRYYTASQMYVDLEEEMNEENIRKASDVIDENLEEASVPSGIETTVTGNPIIRTDIGDTMIEDSVTTISVASLFILLLLVVARGRVYGPVTFVPLFIGLIWTLGSMGLLGIPLTIATIALGAMILGLGVEYGSFITERIIEEKNEANSIEKGVKNSVPSTGLAILGSSMTTVVGFSALLIASISFIRNLGLTLALGISLTLVSALVVTPALLVKYERWKK